MLSAVNKIHYCKLHKVCFVLLLLLGPLNFTEIYNETISGLASTFKVNCPFSGKSNSVNIQNTDMAVEDHMPLTLTAEQPLPP